MSEVFFTSDLHFGHEKIAHDRGFTTVEEHDAAVLGSLYTIPRGSHLWGLGDLSSGRRSHEDYALSLMYELSRDRGLVTHWISGNHDATYAHHGTSHKHQRRFNVVFDSLFPQDKEHKIGSTRVLLSHLPYNGDSHGDKDRYPQQRPRDLGMPIIHGHVHNNYGEAVTRSEQGTLQVCVCWDLWRRPVRQEEIQTILSENRKVHLDAE